MNGPSERAKPGPAGELSHVLALVTARGGSKGIHRKNLRLLDGHPLVGWAVAAGIQAKTVTRTVCSTNDVDIAAAAREYGAEVPFIRPSELSLDDTRDLPVFLHTLDWLQAEESWVPDIVIHLRPTAPLRPIGLLDQSIDLLRSNASATSVRAVCQLPRTLTRCGGFPIPARTMLSRTCNPYLRWRGSMSPTMHHVKCCRRSGGRLAPWTPSGRPCCGTEACPGERSCRWSSIPNCNRHRH